jgi:hypothetical protein
VKELVFNGNQVLVWENEKVLEMDSGALSVLVIIQAGSCVYAQA